MEKSWAGKQDPTAGSSNDFTFLTGVVEDVCVMETWNPEKVASWNQAPKLHYCLDYDRQKAELFVTRLEGMLLADFHSLLCVCLPGHLWLGEHRGLDEHKQDPETCDPQMHGGFPLSRVPVQTGDSCLAAILPPNSDPGTRPLLSEASLWPVARRWKDEENRERAQLSLRNCDLHMLTSHWLKLSPRTADCKEGWEM